MSRKTVSLLLIFWLGYLCVPFTRENLEMLCASRGTGLSDGTFGGLTGAPDLDGDYYADSDGFDPYPHDTVLGRLASTTNPSYEVVAKLPRDPKVHAWWLGFNSSNIPLAEEAPSGGVDGDTCWPAGPQGPARCANYFVAARQSEGLDPQNAFFPWMAGKAEFVHNGKAAALKDLKRAVACSHYDDYATEFYSEAYPVRSGFRPNRPTETYYWMWLRNPPLEDIGSDAVNFMRAFDAESGGPGTNRDFELDALMLQLGKLQRTTGTTPNCRALGARLEMLAIDPRASPAGWDPYERAALFPPAAANWDQTLERSHLMRVARVLGRPEVIQLARSEWSSLREIPGGFRVTMSPDQLPTAVVLAKFERLERLILWTIPFCAVLLAGEWRASRADWFVTANLRRLVWNGAGMGLAVLAILLAGDLIIAVRSIPGEFLAQPTGDYFWAAPGLCAAMPLVVLLAMPLTLVGFAQIATVRDEAPVYSAGSAPVPGTFVEPVFPGSEFLLRCRWFSFGNALFLLVAGFLGACWCTYAVNLSSPDSSSGVAVPRTLLCAPVLLGFLLILIFLPWRLARLPDRPKARTRARVRLVAALTGYLVLATCLFAALEIGRVPVQVRYDAAVRQVIRNGG